MFGWLKHIFSGKKEKRPGWLDEEFQAYIPPVSGTRSVLREKLFVDRPPDLDIEFENQPPTKKVQHAFDARPTGAVRPPPPAPPAKRGHVSVSASPSSRSSQGHDDTIQNMLLIQAISNSHCHSSDSSSSCGSDSYSSSDSSSSDSSCSSSD